MTKFNAFRARAVSAPVFCCILLTTSARVASGHSDPWGDIHPEVAVMDGNFSIVFNTSLPADSPDYTEGTAVYRTIFTPEGKLVAPRHPLGRKRSWRESGPMGLHGGAVRVGDATVIFQGDKEGQPGYLLRSADGKITPVALPWPKDVSLSLFQDVVVTAEGMAITGKENRTDLKFYWFPFGSTASPTILNLGPTACIYDFPVASNPVFAGGKFWVAFMGGGEEEDVTKLLLWSWKPGEKEAKKEVLDSPGFWNSHLSMAAIGDRLCLAYHCETRENPMALQAKIITVFRKAE